MGWMMADDVNMVKRRSEQVTNELDIEDIG
jgi:hypothetical protein